MNQPGDTPQMEHYISDAPYNPDEVDEIEAGKQAQFFASQWTLMWWKLKRHKVAVISGVILALMYASTLVSEVVSPYNQHSRHTDSIYAPPQWVHFFHEGSFVGPFVYGYDYKLNMQNLKREYTPNTNKVDRIRFFVQQTVTNSGTCLKPIFIFSARLKMGRYSCWAPTDWGVM